MKYKATQKDRYGNMKSLEITMDNQLQVPPMTSAVPEYDHPGEPRGTDTVPAWLTPGEFVVNKEATDMYGPLIKEMNDQGREVQDMKKDPMYAKKGSSVEDRKIKIYKHLANEQGLPDNQIAAIMGQIAHESAGSFDPFKLEEGVPKYKQGEGLFQNTPGATRMLAPYNKYLESLGIDKKKMTEDQAIQTQLDFFMKSFMDFGTSGPIAQRTLPGKNPVTAHGYKKANKMKEAFADSNMRVPAVLTDNTPSLTGGLTSFINVPGESLEARSDATEKMLKEINSGKYSDYKYQEDLGNMPTMIGTLPQDPSEIPGGLIVKDIPRPDSDSKSIGRTVMDAAQEGIANTIDTIKSIPSNFTKGAEETKARFNKRKELFTKPNDEATPESAFTLDTGGLIPGIDFPSDPRDNEENFIKKMLGYDDRTSSPTPVTDPGFQDYGEMIPRFPIDYDPQGLGGMPEMEKIDPTFQNILRQTVPAPVPSYDPQGLGGDEFIPEVTPNNMLMNPNAADDLGRNNDMTSIMGGDKSLADAFAPTQIPEPFGMDDPNLMKAMEESFTNEQAYDGTPPEGIGMGMPEPAYTSMYDKMVQDELTGSPEYEIPEVMSMDPQGIGGDEFIPEVINKSAKPDMSDINILDNLTLEQSPGAINSQIEMLENNLATKLNDLKTIMANEPGDTEVTNLYREEIKRLENEIADKKKTQALIDYKKKYSQEFDERKAKEKEQAKVTSLQETITSNDTTQTEKNDAAQQLKQMNIQTPEEIAKEKEKAKLATLAGKVDTNLEAAMTNDPTSAEGQATTTSASQNEPEVSKARKMFDFLFGDMIDSGEIGRAIGVYLGSRALGYDHGSSIGYVAKQYLKRVDAQNAAWDKWSRENMTKFTPASMAKFKRTRNPDDLIPIGNPIRSTGKRQTYYHPTLGKGQAFEFKVANSNGDDTIYWSFDQSGKNQDLVLGPGWTSENVLDVSTEEISLVEKMLQGFQSQHDKKTTGTKAKGNERTMYYSSMSDIPGVIPAAAAAEVAQWLHERGIPPGKFRTPIDEAYVLLVEHNKKRVAEGKPDQIQKSLLPFLQESTVKLRLEDMSYIDDNGKKRLIPSPIKGKIGDEIRTMDTKVLMKLEREISTFFPAGTEDRFWAQAAKAWMNSSETRKEFEEAAKKKVNSEYTPFSLFAQALIGNELQKAAANATQ